MKSVTIAENEDGTFSVYEEKPEAAEPAAAMPGMEAGAEMPMGDMSAMDEEAAPEGQPAASIDEALDLARQMLQDDGRSPEEAMMAGYSKGAPAKKPSPAQVFGE